VWEWGDLVSSECFDWEAVVLRRPVIPEWVKLEQAMKGSQVVVAGRKSVS